MGRRRPTKGRSSPLNGGARTKPACPLPPLNGDDSYNSETGFGYQLTALAAFIGSGGGIILYEPEPAYQEGVQSTGSRTIPDVALVADPATGAWIADPYNLAGDKPFEVVGGTSLSAPCWAGLVALANEGRASAGELALDSSSPTDTLQALYSLPQSDYHVIASGNNGYSAAAGYNLVTALATPMANLLIPDLVAYQGPGMIYSGKAVAAMTSAELVNTQASAGDPADVFSVFDSFVLSTGGDGQNTADDAAALDDGAKIGGRSRLLQTGAGPHVVGWTSVRRPKVSPASQKPQVVAIDAAVLDALLGSGWRARAAHVLDRPRESIKRFFLN